MDLSTHYMGLTLKNPLVVASSPVSANEDSIHRAIDAGAAAIVLYSLFEEQLTKTGDVHPYFPPAEDYLLSPEAYFDLLYRTAGRSGVPIIGSLNGFDAALLSENARKMQEAGAHGLELNLYHVAANPDMTGQEVERRHIEIVQAVKESVDIPVAVKLSPFFSSTGNMVKRLDHLGVDALVFFNRFYQPDFNLAALEMEANLTLSGPEEIRLPLRWIAMMRGLTTTSLGGSTGVESGAEVIKYLLAGADAVMTASALLQNGPEYISAIIRDLEHWMERNEYESVHEFQGRMSQHGVPNPEEFERINYVRVIEAYTKKHLQKSSPASRR